MDKLRISDALFSFLIGFSSELGKNEEEIRDLSDQFAKRIYKETHEELLKGVQGGLIEEKNEGDHKFNVGYVLGSHHAYCIFRQKDFDPLRYLPEHRSDGE